MSDFHHPRFVVLAEGGVRGRVWGRNFYRRSPIWKVSHTGGPQPHNPRRMPDEMPAPPTASVVGFEPEGLSEAYCDIPSLRP